MLEPFVWYRRFSFFLRSHTSHEGRLRKLKREVTAWSPFLNQSRYSAYGKVQKSEWTHPETTRTEPDGGSTQV
jgi:hypothetical protein